MFHDADPLNFSRCPSGMRAEYVRHWLKEDLDEDTPYTTNYMRLSNLFQTEFRDGRITE